MKPAFILASSSPFRQQLLQKIIPEFSTFSPDIDESPNVGESPSALVKRLGLEKARVAKQHFASGIAIGSDQVALHQGDILGKPHTFENAVAQLQRFSAQEVTFLTSLALVNLDTQEEVVIVEPFSVHFRPLTHTQIHHYVEKEQPLYCAGSFKSEGLGICLFSSLQGDDPNALVGLPLLRLNQLLLDWGIDPLSL